MEESAHEQAASRRTRAPSALPAPMMMFVLAIVLSPPFASRGDGRGAHRQPGAGGISSRGYQGQARRRGRGLRDRRPTESSLPSTFSTSIPYSNTFPRCRLGIPAASQSLAMVSGLPPPLPHPHDGAAVTDHIHGGPLEGQHHGDPRPVLVTGADPRGSVRDQAVQLFAGSIRIDQRWANGRGDR